VAHVDRFGNLVTDLPTIWLAGALDLARVEGHETRASASHYAGLAEGQAGLLPGSLGTLELALRGASLAAAWHVRRGALVEILFR
jgi:S-adenosylmethionine hydrolase